MTSFEPPVVDPDDLISTPFGAESTAGEGIAGIDLTGKHAIVTGASSGIGVAAARSLAAAGAAVTLAVRDTDAGQVTADAIRADTGTPVSVAQLQPPRSSSRPRPHWPG